jgi:hypothetical protein
MKTVCSFESPVNASHTTGGHIPEGNIFYVSRISLRSKYDRYKFGLKLNQALPAMKEI